MVIMFDARMRLRSRDDSHIFSVRTMVAIRIAAIEKNTMSASSELMTTADPIPPADPRTIKANAPAMICTRMATITTMRDKHPMRLPLMARASLGSIPTDSLDGVTEDLYGVGFPYKGKEGLVIGSS